MTFNGILLLYRYTLGKQEIPVELRNHTLIKRINRVKILNAIRLHSPIARSQIADMTRLDRKSLTNFISEFLVEGIVAEAGKQEQSMGRPFTMLRFAEGLAAGGIYIAPDMTAGVLIGLDGKKIASARRDFPLYSPMEVIVSSVRELYMELKTAGVKIYGFGLCVPGVIESESGLVRASVNLPSLIWRELGKDFAPTVEEKLYIEDASRSKSLAEKWFGAGRKAGDFVCIDLDVGVGMGIINGRSLYKGAADYAGEIGHIVIERNGRLCRCGNRGCLEAYLARNVVLDEVNRAAGTDFARLEDFSSELNGELEKLLDDYGTKLAMALGSVVNLLSPKIIILNGGLVESFGERMLPIISKEISAFCLSETLSGTKIIASDLEYSAAMGAASLVLSDIFEVPGHFTI